MPLEAQDERYNQRALANFGKYYGVEVRTRVVTVIVKKGEPTIVVDNFDNSFGVIHQAMEGQYFYGYSIPSKYRIKAKKPRIPKMYRPETRISPV